MLKISVFVAFPPATLWFLFMFESTQVSPHSFRQVAQGSSDEKDAIRKYSVNAISEL